ncbi:hypothetical protein SAMN04489726_4928 [Allokutzneria albata]|uniref:Uncharacterized protein n=1 Tax=Allokutzneria albata TaxID=211114 RepID=A0A1G9YMS0_ALLAB|nr:hypothetical protein SAMN04489726_4928 [Allokutzneria albata]
MSGMHRLRCPAESAPDPDERVYFDILKRIGRGHDGLLALVQSGRLHRSEYPPLLHLTLGWQWILDRHSKDNKGRCEGCRRNVVGRRPAWPCSHLREIHSALTD